MDVWQYSAVNRKRFEVEVSFDSCDFGHLFLVIVFSSAAMHFCLWPMTGYLFGQATCDNIGSRSAWCKRAKFCVF